MALFDAAPTVNVQAVAVAALSIGAILAVGAGGRTGQLI